MIVHVLALVSLLGAPQTGAGDRRLDAPVSYIRPRVYLGEMVADLARETGVSLQVDDTRGPASGIHLSVALKRRPLRDVLDAVVTLLGHRDHVFEWQASGRPARYRLVHSATFEAASQAAMRRMMQRWSQDLALVHKTAGMKDEAREAQARARPDLFPGGDAQHGRLDVLARLSAAELGALLSGQFVPVDRAGLSERGRLALSLGLSSPPMGDRPPGLRVRWQELHLGPVLWLGNGDGAEANMLGGAAWDGSWLQADGEGWQHRADATSQAFQQRRAARDPTVGKPAPDGEVYEWLKRLTQNYPDSFLYDATLAQPAGVAGGAWLGSTWGHCVSALVITNRAVAKEVGGITVIRHVTASVHPRRHLSPWKQVDELRQDAAAGDGYLSLDALRRLAGMGAEQRLALREEFPDAALAPVWLPAFAFLDRLTPEARRKLLSREGLPFGEAGLVARQALGEADDPAVAALHLRLLAEAPREAVVSLRREIGVAPINPRNPSKPKEGPVWVWEVRVGDRARATRLFQRPRQPLRPER
jgi:hypothetical protein